MRDPGLYKVTVMYVKLDHKYCLNHIGKISESQHGAEFFLDRGQQLSGAAFYSTDAFGLGCEK